ncbi:MAG TPA: hypothetical protein VES01_03240 [Dermatophilaceae bacterium]|nr:hypothetical protein [Dermatophilaceae bacterium]
MTSLTYGLSPLMCVAAANLGRAVTGEVRWLYAGQRDLDGLTDSDRELIQVVTGELIPPRVVGLGVRVSFFTLHLAMDRKTGVLPGGTDVSVEYLEDVYTRYEQCCPEGNAVSGDVLDVALAFLVGRYLARQDQGDLVA